MEILDADGGSKPDPEPPSPRGGDLDVDLGDCAADADDDLLEEPGATPSAARGAFATLADAGSLALAATLIELIMLSGGYQVVAMMGLGVQGEQTQHEMLSQYAGSIGVSAATCLVLALGALFRVRPDTPPWVRAAAGSAVIVGVLMAAVSGYVLWQVAGAAPDTGSTVFGTSG